MDKTELLNFTLGENIGEILTDIAREKLMSGNIAGVFEVFNCVGDLKVSEIHDILLGRAQLKKGKEQNTIDLVYREREERNGPDVFDFDWDDWMVSRVEDLKNQVMAIQVLENNNGGNADGITRTLDFESIGKENPVLFTSAACVALGVEDEPSRAVYAELEERVRLDAYDVTEEERSIYRDMQYLMGVMELLRILAPLLQTCTYLCTKMGRRYPKFYSYWVDKSFRALDEFITNVRISVDHGELEKKVMEQRYDILSFMENDERGKNFSRLGMVPCEISDVYDAGWLSPEGLFFGEIRSYNSDLSRNNFLHLRLAERLVQDPQYAGREELALEKSGWLKVDKDSAFGCGFGWDGKPLYPTKHQIESIIYYIRAGLKTNRIWNRPNTVVGRSDGAREATWMLLKSMDSIQRRNFFMM